MIEYNVLVKFDGCPRSQNVGMLKATTTKRAYNKAVKTLNWIHSSRIRVERVE